MAIPSKIKTELVEPILDNPMQMHTSTAAIPATATATVEQIVTGYIICTSAAATTITLPTGTLLGAALKATKGTVFDLFIDNTGGANTVTMAIATNGILWQFRRPDCSFWSNRFSSIQAYVFKCDSLCVYTRSLVSYLSSSSWWGRYRTL